MTVLGYRPFLEPLPIEPLWVLLVIPLVLGVAVVYKTLKLDDLTPLPREAAVLAGQVLLFMVGLAVLISGVMWLL